jgi:hypothetical protein
MQEFLAVEMLAARFSPAANLASPDLLDTRTRIVCIEDMERCGINGITLFFETLSPPTPVLTTSYEV